uniref:Uncharacterized protein n=1 Tax=Anopheles atroparvus TaxID=41427 RepID=A0A182IUX0_ANOAO
MADYTARNAYREINGPQGHCTAPTHTSLAFHTFTGTSRRLMDEDSLHRKCFEYSELMMRAAWEDVKSLRKQRNDAFEKLNTANQQLHQVREENELLKIENDKQTLRFEKARTDAELESRGAIAQLKRQNEQLARYLNLLIGNFGLHQAGKPSEIENGTSEKPIGEVRRTAILKLDTAEENYCDCTESIEQDGQRHAEGQQQQPQPKQKQLLMVHGRSGMDGSNVVDGRGSVVLDGGVRRGDGSVVTSREQASAGNGDQRSQKNKLEGRKNLFRLDIFKLFVLYTMMAGSMDNAGRRVRNRGGMVRDRSGMVCDRGNMMRDWGNMVRDRGGMVMLDGGVSYWSMGIAGDMHWLRDHLGLDDGRLLMVNGRSGMDGSNMVDGRGNVVLDGGV